MNALPMTIRTVGCRIGLLMLIAAGPAPSVCCRLFAEERPPAQGHRKAAAVTFQQTEHELAIQIDGRRIAEYVFDDEEILRPYFRHLRTPSGVQVTRTHPPVEGVDRIDHATMHPGLWLAFGDLSGADFWRNRGRMRHVRFIREPQGGIGSGSFAVENAYQADGRTICIETSEITVSLQPHGYLLDWRSTFRSANGAFRFGDQEEMGLGVRVATPLAVEHGGTIVDSEGRRNESQVWGRQADWCRYGGAVGERQVGVVLMPAPGNFRRCWFHARDYGLLVANPFGRRAFTGAEAGRVTVDAGDEFRLRFGVLVYEAPAEQPLNVEAAFQRFANE